MLKEIIQVPGTLGKSYIGKNKGKEGIFNAHFSYYEFNTVVCCGWRVDIMQNLCVLHKEPRSHACVKMSFLQRTQCCVPCPVKFA